jgi:predicted MFS family arabinose efflux permease
VIPEVAAAAARSTYAELLGIRTLRWMFGAAFFGRLPYGIEVLATVMFFSARTGSYAAAGVVAGALSAGIAIGSVTQSRRIDRRGSSALLPLGVAHAAFAALLIAGGAGGWPDAMAAGIAFAAGLVIPPTSSVVRSLYTSALGDRQDLASQAFALDAAVTESTYVVGLAVVSVLVLVADPAVALAVGAASCLVAIGILVAVAPGPGAEPAPARRIRGALGAPAVAILVLATIPLGIAFGILEVALPAFASAQGEPSAGALMFVAMAVGGAMSSMGAGAWGEHVPHARVVVAGSFAYPLVALLPIAGSSPMGVALLVLPFGLVNGPWILGRNVLTGRFARPGTTTEAFAWLVTALLLGAALGNALGGMLVEQTSWRGAILAGALVTTLTVAVTVSSRAALQAAR